MFDDADAQSAANGAAFACFVASGQTCVSGTRLVVQDKIYDDFMARFMDKVESITRRMGSRKFISFLLAQNAWLTLVTGCSFSLAANPQSTMGTVISMRQLERIEALVQRGVGKILAGGKRMRGTSPLDGYDFSQGAFFPPTVITDVPTEDDLWREEIFGPVVVVTRFSVSYPAHLAFSSMVADS